MTECRTCGRPITFLATGDDEPRWFAVEPGPPVLIELGEPRQFVAAVTAAGDLVQGFLPPATPPRTVRAHLRHFFYRACKP